MDLNVGMLVATRNRKNEIEALLNSLVDQGIEQIVVSSSGEDISSIVEKFRESLNVEYIKSEPGQIRQKMNGIKALRSDLDWVIFSDDDVEYPNYFISQLKNSIIGFEETKLTGIGFQITNANLRHESRSKKLFNRLFFLQFGEPGRVYPSGDCIPYSDINKPLATMWLNGASAWRYRTVLEYWSPVPETKYAAYEDAIFSYGNYVNGNLVFLPQLQLRYQVPANQTSLNTLTFEAFLLWKMYFVIRFKLSFPKFTWSSVGLSLVFLFNSNTYEKLNQKLLSIYRIWRYIFVVAGSQNREMATIEIIKYNLPTA